ncbi:MAG: hypothetical protein GTN99_02795 [Candidatus Dadabacteria bacterium]|nr:hypothetical protein [Candidatus Dadabacteria bacterium]
MNATAEVLPRIIDFPVPQVQDVLSKNTADRFVKTLDYKGQRKQFENNLWEQKTAKFVNFLISLGCAPFEPKAVKAYQAKECIKATLKYKWFLASFVCIAICTMIATLIYGFMFGTVAGAIGGIIVAFIEFCFSVWISNIIDKNYDGFYDWRSERLEDFEGYIPTEALLQAEKIKEEYGQNVFFAVESLSRRKHIVDPFLKVWFHGTYFYIAVWDEDWTIVHQKGITQ